MGLFGPSRPSHYAVVDIGSSSIGAAYVSIHEKDAPLVVYAVRTPYEGRSAGPTDMLRTLDATLRDLTTNGGPILKKVTGHAQVEGSYVYVGAPWQVSELTAKRVEKEKPFQFTKEMLAEALRTAPGGRSTIVASLMNGYETVNPIGKRVKRADTIVLASHIEPQLQSLIYRAVRGATGSSKLQLYSFGELAPPAISAVAGGEEEFLVLRVTKNATSFAFIKRGLLAGTRSLAVGTRLFIEAARERGVSSLRSITEGKGLIDKSKSGRLASRLEEAQRSWLLQVREGLRELAAGRALPRAVFLFAEGPDAHFVSRLLNAPEIHDLWLSDEPLTVVPITSHHFDPFLHRVEGSVEDPFLDALALVASRG